LFNSRNNIEDAQSKIVSIVKSHKYNFNSDTEQILSNLEDNRIECFNQIDCVFKQLKFTTNSFNEYKDLDIIKERLYDLIDKLGDKYSDINDLNVKMNE